jgi:hypothetical protein
MNTILAITALVVALGIVAAFTIAIPALEGHIALAKNTRVKNPNYKGANRHNFGCGTGCG